MSLNLRGQVVRTLLAVQQGQSLAQILNQQLQRVEAKDRALFHELLLGTLRHWFALKALALPLFKKELNNPTLEACLYVGLYQVLCTRIAHHASISETVEACKQLGYGRCSGVVNAILRRATRETEAFQTTLQQAHGLPSWLFKRLKKDWGEASETLFQQLKLTAPLTLRVNTQKTHRAAYLSQLADLHIQAVECRYAEQGIQLLDQVQIPQLPQFQEGAVTVQDEHAQLAIPLFLQALGEEGFEQKVIVDACAAPGGKTTHLMEKSQFKQLIALDHDEQRLQKVTENIQRLQLNQQTLTLLTADATTWQAETPVDGIVLDAPCSATGVIRRHPDIRLLRQSSDISQLVELQQRILDNMWNQLRVGGVMLYITCSILKAENEMQMQAFFERHSQAQEIKIQATWGGEQHYGRQLFPSEKAGDGFYYCLIQKLGEC